MSEGRKGGGCGGIFNCCSCGDGAIVDKDEFNPNDDIAKKENNIINNINLNNNIEIKNTNSNNNLNNNSANNDNINNLSPNSNNNVFKGNKGSGDEFFIKGDGMNYSMDVDNNEIRVDKANRQNNASSCGAYYETNKGKYNRKIEFTLRFKRQQKEKKENINVPNINNNIIQKEEKEDRYKNYKMTFERNKKGKLKVTMHDVENNTDIEVKILSNETVKKNIKKDFKKICEKIAESENKKNTYDYGITKGSKSNTTEMKKDVHLRDLILSMVENNFFVDNLRKLDLSDDIIKKIVPEPFLAYDNAIHHQIDETKYNIEEKMDKDKSKPEEYFQEGVILGIKESKKDDNRKLDESNINSNVDDKNDNKKSILKDFLNVDVNSSIKLSGKNHLLKHELLKLQKSREELAAKEEKNNRQIKSNNLRRVKYGNYFSFKNE